MYKALHRIRTEKNIYMHEAGMLHTHQKIEMHKTVRMQDFLYTSQST